MANILEQLFGIKFNRASDKNQPESFAPPIEDDGATVVVSAGYGGTYGTVVDLDGTIRGEADLITQYRNMAKHPEVFRAIDEIVNEAIVVSDEEPAIQLNLDELDGLPDALKQAFFQEFDQILRLLEWNVKSYDIFRTWYIDGRLNYHVIIDREAPALGITEVRFIDPRKIKKVREISRKRSQGPNPVTIQVTRAEYYVYNDAGYNSKVSTPLPSAAAGTANIGLKISDDAVVYVVSGLVDENGLVVLSHLHQAIRPLNMLRTMEDSAVIYRLVRAPERRVWYIDTGTLPKHKAEQAVYDMMTRHKNKLVYDPASGTIKDHRRHTTMLEDIWLSRREGNKGTQVETLPGSQNLGQMEEVDYFLRKLYKALNVPISRLEPEIMYTVGRDGQISRDEVSFTKFIDRLRTRFNSLFLQLLEKQLILKGYVSPDEWEQIKPLLKFTYAKDNYYSELKENEIFMGRLAILEMAMPYAGRFFPNEWIRRDILKQSDEQMEEFDEIMMEERLNPLYMVQLGPEGEPLELEPGLSAPPMASKPKPQDKKK